MKKSGLISLSILMFRQKMTLGIALVCVALFIFGCKKSSSSNQTDERVTPFCHMQVTYSYSGNYHNPMGAIAAMCWDTANGQSVFATFAVNTGAQFAAIYDWQFQSPFTFTIDSLTSQHAWLQFQPLQNVDVTDFQYTYGYIDTAGVQTVLFSKGLPLDGEELKWPEWFPMFN